MELRLRDVARLLGVSEKTVYRLVRESSLPAHRVHDQYRFNAVELQEWAASQKRRISPELFADEALPGRLPSLADALQRGGIHYGISGARRDEVLEAVTRLPSLPETVDRSLLLQLLKGREALASTGVGDGIAMPHPRDPAVVPVQDPLVLLCFLRSPIDFKALDGQLVDVLFTMLSPSVRAHLQLLSKLAFVLHDETLRTLLRERAPSEEILARVRYLESGQPTEVR